MLSQLPFMTRGLLVALLGLCGTFLVLVLVYLGVKLMQKVGTREKQQSHQDAAS